LFVPLFGASNAVPGIEQLSLSLAGRYEHYSDFGDTTNPKFGVTWKPVPELTVRASYGTSFRAPTFVEVSQVAGGAGLYYDTLPGPTGNLADEQRCAPVQRDEYEEIRHQLQRIAGRVVVRGQVLRADRGEKQQPDHLGASAPGDLSTTTVSPAHADGDEAADAGEPSERQPAQPNPPGQ